MAPLRIGFTDVLVVLSQKLTVRSVRLFRDELESPTTFVAIEVTLSGVAWSSVYVAVTVMVLLTSAGVSV